MYKFFFNVHLYTSLIVFPFMLIFAVTGSMMAFEPEIDRLLHAKLSYVEPGPKALTLAEISDKVQKAFPKDTINAYKLAASPDISWQIHTNNKTVYMDQYTGKILGTVTSPDFWQKTQQNIHQLHLRLAFSDKHDTGRSIMSWAGVILLVTLSSGLVLWWRQKRIAIRRSVPARPVWFDWHSLIGVVSFIFLMVFAFTGVMIGFANRTIPMFYKLTGSKPTEMPDIKITAPINAKLISPDSAIQLARAALPGVVPFYIQMPGPTEAYDIRCRYPEDLTPGGRSRVMIDPYSGKVLFAEGSKTIPAGTQLIVINRAIHTGDIFGIFSKSVMSLASSALAFQVISGLRMWWLRKWKKKKAKSII
jgi:uncharacterized iron-regulated membrane protein